VIILLRRPTDALTGAPRLAAAMLQAMTSGEPGVAPLLAAITEPLVAETAHAIRPTGPTPADHELARTIQRVCFAALVGWLTATDTHTPTTPPRPNPRHPPPRPHPRPGLPIHKPPHHSAS